MKEQSVNSNWSAPFHGVQHLDGPRTDTWATVQDHGSFARLACNFPGSGMNPIKSFHDTAEQARAAGEAWIKGQRA